jgi:hypothetical protein
VGKTAGERRQPIRYLMRSYSFGHLVLDLTGDLWDIEDHGKRCPT